MRLLRARLFRREVVLRRRLILAGLTSLLLLGAWFLGVDRTWYIDECPDCGYHADVEQYRVLTFPVADRVAEYPTVIQRVAADLGTPCTHSRLDRMPFHRQWGLLFCAAPCLNLPVYLDDAYAHAWYDGVAARVREMGAADPKLGEEWHRRVILGHDRGYSQRFFERLGAGAREPVEAPR